MKTKLYKIPKDDKFKFEGLECYRGEFIEADNVYKCDCPSKKMFIYLGPNTNVNLVVEHYE